MSNKLSRLKTQRDDELSNRFRLWLNKDRGRQVKGIEYFLKKRSDNTDLLITEIAKEHGLNKIPSILLTLKSCCSSILFNSYGVINLAY